ncbi:MAG: bifunctional diaminohydroxyphosphoribosylaminopyrimidine deaminase/5-amino-6-(5-phosphoribosylamino)uracil reductase RibD [Wolinella sp.]
MPRKQEGILASVLPFDATSPCDSLAVPSAKESALHSATSASLADCKTAHCTGDSRRFSSFLPHDFYMDLALKEAWKYQGLTFPNPAVGSLLLGAHGEILALRAHKQAGAPHAEVLALQEGYARLSGDDRILALTQSRDIHDYLLRHHNGIFAQCTLYVTLEPCNHEGKTPPCARLIASLGIGQILIGAQEAHPLASGGIATLKKQKIPCIAGIKEEACRELLTPFARFHEKGRFCFFKWAQRLNGTLAPGIISSLASREHVHALRDKIDLLIISGKSARDDDPLLDARLIQGHAPDILILTRDSCNIPRSLRLFSVPHRHVLIATSLAELERHMRPYRYIMIEGGAGLFSVLFDYVDLFLLYLAPSLEQGSVHLHIKNPLKLLHIHTLGEDMIVWLAKAPPVCS